MALLVALLMRFLVPLAGAVAWRLGADAFSGDRAPQRWLAGAVGLALGALGAVFLRLLVANDGDNAYIGLYLIGGLLVLAGMPFVLAALLPGHGRRRTIQIAFATLWAASALAALLLLWALAVIPTQNYDYDPRVFRNHLLAFVLLVGAVTPVSFVLLRHMR